MTKNGEWPTDENELKRIESEAYRIIGDRHASNTRKFIAESALRKLNRMKEAEKGKMPTKKQMLGVMEEMRACAVAAFSRHESDNAEDFQVEWKKLKNMIMESDIPDGGAGLPPPPEGYRYLSEKEIKDQSLNALRVTDSMHSNETDKNIARDILKQLSVRHPIGLISEWPEDQDSK